MADDDPNESSQTSFLGTGWTFPPVFSRAGNGVRMVSDEEDIEQSLTILLATAAGERILEPTYGCNLHDLLFEPLNTGRVTYVAGMVKQAILHGEPRIELNGVSVEDNPGFDGQVNLRVDYTVRSTNSRYNIVFPFYREEATSAQP
jgi:phage baseplate assembly protein W